MNRVVNEKRLGVSYHIRRTRLVHNRNVPWLPSRYCTTSLICWVRLAEPELAVTVIE